MQRKLDNGFIVRSLDEGIDTDRERLPEFYRTVFKEESEDEGEFVAQWTQDLLDGLHPYMNLADFVVAVDPAEDDRIVSATLLLPQRINYQGIELAVGQPEIVGTDKAYRRRGLVREVFKMIHERSESLGHVMQFIGGIPYFYRQFGYAMAIDMGGRYYFPFARVKKLKDGESSRFTFRRATEADIPELKAIYDANAHHYLTYSALDEVELRYHLSEKRPKNPNIRDVYLICDTKQDDVPVGFVMLGREVDKGEAYCSLYMVGDKSSYLATLDDTMREMKRVFNETLPDKEIDGVTLRVEQVPVLETLFRRTYGVGVWQYPYNWYVRIPHPAQFIKQIAPAMEANLRGSVANAYSGDLRVGFYKREHLKMTFEDGKLIDAVMEADDDAKLQAQFPFDTFWNVVFGHKSLFELRENIVDVNVNREGWALLESLFPKKPSNIIMLG